MRTYTSKHTNQLNDSWILPMVKDIVENNAMNKGLAVNTRLHLLVFNMDLLDKVYLNCNLWSC